MSSPERQTPPARTPHRSDPAPERVDHGGKFGQILQEAVVGIALLDLDGAIRECNPALARLMGLEPDEACGTWLVDLTHPIYRQQATDLFREMRDTGREARGEVGLLRKDGSLAWARLSLFLARTREGDPDYAIAILEEIPSERRLLDAIHLMATTDDLTGLHNRRGFFLLAEQQWRVASRSGRDLALLYVDLNGLKKINDSYGHSAGDDAIRATAEILRGSCRDSDIVARLGGDEFVLLMVEAGEVGVELLRSRILHALANQNTWSKRPYRLSVSLGMSRFAAGEPRKLEEMLEEADARMYEEKRRRR